MTSLIKRIAFDTAGVLLIIIAVPIGWLPGPGGIPLALIGLGLLAKNNRWAQDLLNDFENKFRYYSRRIKHAPPAVQLVLDMAALSLLGLGIYTVATETGISQVIATAAITTSLIMLLINRGRGERLLANIRRQKP
jgi:hypothetical protein